MQSKAAKIKKNASFFDNIWTTSPLVSMEKLQFQNFVKVLICVLKVHWKVESSNLYIKLCIYYLALQLLQSKCYLILILSHNIEVLVNMKMHCSLWEINFVNYFWSLTVV